MLLNLLGFEINFVLVYLIIYYNYTKKINKEHLKMK